MRSAPARVEVLILSALPAEVAAQLAVLREHGMSVHVASRPERALELLLRRPHLVLVDLIHGPALNRGVVDALNREPRVSRVVALHDGDVDSYLDQVEHLTVDGFCRLESFAGVPGSGK
jgi:DNA-binding response OmpR family regulator